MIGELFSRFRYTSLNYRLTILEKENSNYKRVIRSLEDMLEQCKMRVDNLATIVFTRNRKSDQDISKRSEVSNDK